MNRNWRISIIGILRFLLCAAGAGLLWWFFQSYLFFLMILLLMLAAVCSLAAFFSYGEELSVKVTMPELLVGKDKWVQTRMETVSTRRILSFPAEITYQIRNVFTGYQSQEKIRLWIGPGTQVIQEKELKSSHVGRVETEIVSFKVWDFLHLVCRENPNRKNAFVIAFPGFEEVQEEEIVSCIEGFPQELQLKKNGMDAEPDIEIREYIPGDNLKTIHWKMTAKTGKVMVRERISTGRDKVNLLLALTGDESVNDELMRSLQSLGQLLLEKGYPVRVCYLGAGDRLSAHYLLEQGELQNVLEEILSISGKKNPDDARDAMEAEYPGEAYVIVRNGAYKGEYIR